MNKAGINIPRRVASDDDVGSAVAATDDAYPAAGPEESSGDSEPPPLEFVSDDSGPSTIMLGLGDEHADTEGALHEAAADNDSADDADPLQSLLDELSDDLEAELSGDKASVEPTAECSEPSAGSCGTALLEPSVESSRTAVLEPSAESPCGTAVFEPKAESCGTAILEPKAESCVTAVLEPKAESCGTAVCEPKAESSGTAVCEPKAESSGTAVCEPKAESSGTADEEKEPGRAVDRSVLERRGPLVPGQGSREDLKQMLAISKARLQAQLLPFCCM